jgi:rhodanese-related sulfurtransferase
MLQEAKEVCPTTTRRLATEGALLVDVREACEVQALTFDVPAIVNIPLQELEKRWSELPKDREIVLVCESGARSLKATYYLQYHGYTQVSNMSGGILKWMKKGFPVIGQRLEAGACSTGCCGSGCTPADAADASSCCAAAPAASSTCC